MSYKEINEEKTGFKFETNVWELFTEAEQRDDVDIEELYRKLFREWRNDVKLVAELSMCMNWKLREHYRKKNESLAELYNSLRMRVHDYALDVFT
jgi:adenylate cyclase